MLTSKPSVLNISAPAIDMPENVPRDDIGRSVHLTRTEEKLPSPGNKDRQDFRLSLADVKRPADAWSSAEPTLPAGILRNAVASTDVCVTICLQPFVIAGLGVQAGDIAGRCSMPSPS
ncbi:hypothetical protein [uncultured Bradyrhizobium sp.]|uniref:hypothetical protein n=1 Tax=uncultured Bradyrhizobium sp. TaxID=199684 RepID=UPI0035CAC23D